MNFSATFILKKLLLLRVKQLNFSTSPKKEPLWFQKIFVAKVFLKQNQCKYPWDHRSVSYLLSITISLFSVYLIAFSNITDWSDGDWLGLKFSPRSIVAIIFFFLKIFWSHSARAHNIREFFFSLPYMVNGFHYSKTCFGQTFIFFRSCQGI